MMKFRVLLISDDVATTKMMQNIIRHHRHLSSEEVGDGASAITHISQEPLYHIILCDLSTGNPGCIEVLKASKARSPDTKVIVITGFGDHQLVIDAIKAGAYGYLHKPFRPEEMNLVLNNLTTHFQQFEKLQNLNMEISEMETTTQQKIFRIQELEKDLKALSQELKKYEPQEEVLDLNMAIARAAAQRTGTAKGYSVSRELSNLNNLLEDKKISKEEYSVFRRNILEKAYQIPIA